MNTIKFAKKLAIPLFVALAYGPSQGLAQSILGNDLDDYAILARSGVTNAGAFSSNVIGGSIGSLPTAPASTGWTFLPPGGILQPANVEAAHTQLDAAISTLNLMPGGIAATSAGALTGTTAPGVYDFAAIGNINGNLILDGSGPSANVWIFRFSSSLITSTTSTVTVTGVGDGSDVGIYWVVGSSATLDGPVFAGNVLATASITSDGFLNLGCGRLLAGAGATGNVTLLGNNLISTGCAGIGSGSDGFDQGNMVPVPEPETYAMLLAGLGMMGFVARRRQRNLAAAA